jgi:hypothetical protein
MTGVTGVQVPAVETLSWRVNREGCHPRHGTPLPGLLYFAKSRKSAKERI